MTPESKLKRDCRRFAESRGCKLYPASFKGRKGFPDHLLICPAQGYALIEFKVPGTGRLSQHQVVTIIELRMAGLEVWVVYDVDQFHSHLGDLLARPIRLS